MPRIVFATVASFVLATLHVTAQQPPRAPEAARSPIGPGTHAPQPKLLPGTRAGVFSAIQGNALSPMDAALPNTIVRLRDARFGQIVERELTDSSGLFEFPKVDPGSYIVEIIGSDQASVLAASQVLNVSAGEAVSAVVKLPFLTPRSSGQGNATTSPAAAVASQAAAANVVAAEAAGAQTCVTLQQ